jgi:hypothetical protein
MGEFANGLGGQQRLNLYAYVGDGPLNSTDPLGLNADPTSAMWTRVNVPSPALPSDLKFQPLLTGVGAVVGGAAATGGSFVADAATLGVNIPATPAETAVGAAAGAAVGSAAGKIMDDARGGALSSDRPFRKLRPVLRRGGEARFVAPGAQVLRAAMHGQAEVAALAEQSSRFSPAWRRPVKNGASRRPRRWRRSRS